MKQFQPKTPLPRIKPWWPHPKLVNGKQLKAGRVILNMSISDMATAAGVHRSTIMRLERRKNLPLYLGVAINIANILVENGIKFICENNRAGISFSAQSCRHPVNYHNS